VSPAPLQSVEPSRDATAGWRLPDKYQVLRILGVGGMGTVLLARDRSLGRLCAVKLLSEECPTWLARFRREARILAGLDHPSIVRVHDLDVFEGRTYLAMEYVRGGSLALARLEPVPLVRALRGVVEGLGVAHERGIVHRDVKPENVLLDRARESRDGVPVRAVLTDFGLAVSPFEEEGGRRAVVGTPLTMSPEQVRGEPVTSQSDVFSLGVTLFRQLTGEWPFRGRRVTDVLEAIVHHPTPPLPDTSRRLETIVQRCLAKDPAQRFASMEELGRALDRFLRGRALVAFAQSLFPHRRPAPDGPRIHPRETS
jgi:serine/threonine-protein kinase